MPEKGELFKAMVDLKDLKALNLRHSRHFPFKALTNSRHATHYHYWGKEREIVVP
jgi:hypothetical protein